MNDRKTPKSQAKAAESGKNDGSPSSLDRSIQAKLGDQLRQMYNDVVSEGVPDRFADLLAQLEKTPDPKEDKPL